MGMTDAISRQHATLDSGGVGEERAPGTEAAEWGTGGDLPAVRRSLEDQADALLGGQPETAEPAGAGSPAWGEEASSSSSDLFSSDPAVLKLWQAAAGQYGIDEEEGELAWQADALCAQTDPEAFFPEKGGSTRDAKRVCSECPVSEACLDYALAKDERFGIWGGLSERERRRLRKRAG
jgi:WhiB family redox-sensing transcriptional regulator